MDETKPLVIPIIFNYTSEINYRKRWIIGCLCILLAIVIAVTIGVLVGKENSKKGTTTVIPTELTSHSSHYTSTSTGKISHRHHLFQSWNR
jgi:uncharacterized membrane protein YraQ (UPF0718 family)